MTELEKRLLEAGDALARAAYVYAGARNRINRVAFFIARDAWEAIAREMKEIHDDA